MRGASLTPWTSAPPCRSCPCRESDSSQEASVGPGLVVPSQSDLYPSDVAYTWSHGSYPGLKQSPGLGSSEPPSTVLNSYCPLKASFKILRVKLNAEKHILDHVVVGVGAHGRNTYKPRTWEVEAGDSAIAYIMSLR